MKTTFYRSTILPCCLLISALFAEAADVTVSYRAKVNLGSGDTLHASTISAKQFPAALADKVLYHFDAQNTTGWEFTDANQTAVTKIPSDYGTRYLTSLSEATWDPANWGAAHPFQSPAYVKSVAALGGKPAVDFGALGSEHALVFNPDTANENKNLVSGIGTIIAVWGSEHGGGWLLSGGVGSNQHGGSTLSGYLGHRAVRDPAKDADDELYSWRNPLWKDPAWYSVRDAKVYHDGQPGAAKYVGFNGGWEVLSVVLNTTSGPLPNTAGIGINDARAGVQWRSSGMGVAEIYYFSEQLGDADRQAVEAYLQDKWFGRTTPGHNGEAEVGLVRVNKSQPDNNPAWHVDAAINVAAGDTLMVDELMGGRRGGTLTKSGAGTLALGKSAGYGGTLKVAEGGVAFARRTTPTTLPDNPWFRLDASDTMAMEMAIDGEVTYVTKWSNKAENPIAGNAADTLCFVAPTEAARPVLITDALGTGKNAIDFGILNSGRQLNAKGGASAADLKIPGITAAFVVMAPTFSGGSVFGDPLAKSVRSFLDRGADDAQYTRGILGYTLPLWLTSVWHDNTLSMAFNGNSGTTRSNGRLIDPDKGFFTTGWQVLAVTTPGAEVSSIGGGRINCTYSGGFRVAEIVLYNRPLTDIEVKDASAYLTEKWLGRNALGYAARSAAATPELLKLTLGANTSVAVPAGTVARVGTLATEGMFVKEGAGTLEVETLPSAIDLRVDGGTIRTAAKSDPAAFDQPAADPAFHLDASNDKSLVYHPASCGTTNYVMQWHDTRGSGNVAFCPQPDYATYAPYVDTTRKQNGHAVLDFGVNDTEYRRLHFNRSQDAIRSAFVVWGTRGKALSAGVLLGSASSATDIDASNYADHYNGQYDFLRNGASLFAYFYYTEPVYYASIFVNGERTNADYKPVEGFQLVEVHTGTGVHASALNEDRQGDQPTGATYAGGMSYGEILLYERELTEREKIATRNYLMKKWFGKTDDELTPLPGDAPVAPALNVNGLYAGADSHFDGSIAPADVRGEAGSKATIEGNMTIGDLNVYTGALVVASDKTLTVTSGGALVRGNPGLVTEGRIMHLDASNGAQADASGIVTNWNNLAGGPLHAIPSGNPKLLTDSTFGGRPYVYMRGWSWRTTEKDNGRTCFHFADQDGQTNRLANIRSAFWVLNSSEGGGILLSGGNTITHNAWYRGPSKENQNFRGMVYPSAPITTSGTYGANASWWLNAAEVNPLTTGLSGGNDLISMNFRTGDPSGSAWGFAFNGWYYDPNDRTIETCGWQMLAELIIYDRELSVTERTAVEAYLSAKWGLGQYKRTSGEAVNVALESGSTLNLSGNNCGLGTLTGSGTVENAGELRVKGLDVGAAGGGAAQMSVYGDLTLADGATWNVAAGNGALAVCGQLSFEGAITFDLTNLDASETTDGVVYLASATSFGTLPAHSQVTAIGTEENVRLFVRGDKLYLRVKPRGFILMVK